MVSVKSAKSRWRAATRGLISSPSEKGDSRRNTTEQPTTQSDSPKIRRRSRSRSRSRSKNNVDEDREGGENLLSSNERSGAQWKALANEQQQSSRPPLMNPSSLTNPPPPPPPPGPPPKKNKRRSSAKKRDSSTSVSQKKKQLDSGSEIPRGLVSNSPFQPSNKNTKESCETLQPAQEPALKYNTEIPRGKVKGMSDLFAGKSVSNATDLTLNSSSSRSEVPENHMSPVEAPELSSAANMPTKVLKPKAIPASQSDEELQPLRLGLPENEDGDGEKAPLTMKSGETDPWAVPSTPLNHFFGQGWGETAEEVSPSKSTPSKANDEFENNDWFNDDTNSKSAFPFYVSTPPRESASAGTRSSVSDTDNGDTKLNQVDDSMAASGSFAAAIQPVVTKAVTSKPSTITEEDEVDSAVERQNDSSTSTPTRRPAIPKPDRRESLEVSSMLETPESQVPNSTSSRASRGSPGSKSKSFSFRSRSPRRTSPAIKSPPGKSTPTDKDSSEKKRRGLFKIFSRKDMKSSPSTLKIGADSPEMSERMVHSKQVDEPQTFASLRGVFEDAEKSRSKGYISTRDDASLVSEVTNPTVFQSKTPSNESYVSNNDRKTFAFNNESKKSSNDSTGSERTSTLNNTSKNLDEVASKSTAENRDSGSDRSNSDSKNNVKQEFSEAEAKVDTGNQGKSTEESSSKPDPFELNSAFFSTVDPFASFTGAAGDKGGITEMSSEDPFNVGAIALSPSKSKRDSTKTRAKSTRVGSKVADPSFKEEPSASLSANDVQGAGAINFPSNDKDMGKVAIGQDMQMKSRKTETRKSNALSQSEGTHIGQSEELQKSAASVPIKNESRRAKLDRRLSRTRTPSPMSRRKEAASPITVQRRDNVLPPSTKEPPIIISDKPSSSRSVSSALKKSNKTDTITPMQVRAKEAKMKLSRSSSLGNHTSLRRSYSCDEESTSVKASSSSQDHSDHFSKLIADDVGSKLTQKMRNKRNEKRINQADSTEVSKPERESEVHSATTSAYLSKFKPKVSQRKQEYADDRSLDSYSSRKSVSSSQDSKACPTEYYRSSRRMQRLKNSRQSGASDKSSKTSEPKVKPQSTLKSSEQTSYSRRVESESAVSSFDFEDVKDPLQRAGLRLLTAAVVPIQTEARRFLAKRRTKIRLQSIVRIQSSARKWLALRDIDRKDLAALMIQKAFANHLTREYARTLIQALARGWLVRKKMLEQMSAILIQTNIRRWLAEIRFRKLVAALLLQSNIRMWSARCSYRKQVGALRMQSLVRRWIARNYFVTEISALRIQTAYRGFAAYSSYWEKLIAAIHIQAAYRGWLTRDSYLDKKYCATQIQKVFRGYRATLSVYSDIYKVTLIQSVVRMKIAVDYATYKMAFIIQMQSLIRGYLVRQRFKSLNSKATLAQKVFRGYLARLNFQFDLIDIILVQSLIRQRKARKTLSQVKHDREIRSAIKIQSQWRSYDCNMNYLHLLRDVVIVQSVTRTWKASKHVHQCREERYQRSAALIQSAARGSMTRKSLKRKSSAIAIQKVWRGHVCYTSHRNYVMATTIQKAWRGYFCHNNYTKYMAATAIQKTWRGRSRERYFTQYLAARKVQKIWRGHVQLTDYSRHMSARIVQKIWRGHVLRRYFVRYISARRVQTVWRGLVKRNSYRRYIAARRIQKVWRGYRQHHTYTCYTAARLIQKTVRGRVQHDKYARYVAARKIQKSWRGITALSNYKNYVGARSIQRTWRGYVCFSVHKQYIAARVIQTLLRGRVCQRDYKQNVAAMCVQTHWRGHSRRVVYKRILAAILIQKVSRGAAAKMKFKQNIAAATVQKHWRGASCRTDYKRTRAAIIIQKSWRGYSGFAEYVFAVADIVLAQSQIRCWLARRKRLLAFDDKDNSSTILIQRHWRGHFRRQERICKLRSIVHIQSFVRGTYAQRKYRKYVLDKRSAEAIQFAWVSYTTRKKQYESARSLQRMSRGMLKRRKFAVDLASHRASIKIQAAWRGFWQYSSYLITLDMIIRVQALARRYLARAKMSREEQMATRIQGLARSKFARHTASSKAAAKNLFISGAIVTNEEVNAARTIQCAARKSKAQHELIFHLLARKIQSNWRKSGPRKTFKQYRSSVKIQTWWRRLVLYVAYKKYKSAITIQSAWRVSCAREEHKRNESARQIQTSWRCSSTKRKFHHYICARNIQAYWRASSSRRSYKCYKSARKIQTTWIANKKRQEFRRHESVRSLQTLWRMKSSREQLKRHVSARSIQTRWRAAASRSEYQRYIAAKKLQSTWRKSNAQSKYKSYTASRKIQTLWRKYYALSQYKQYLASQKIQSLWRARVASLEYKRYIGARKLQTTWRATTTRSKYKSYISARKIQSAWRMYSAHHVFKQYRGAKKIQAAWRCHVAREKYQYRLAIVEAATIIQTAWRGFICYTDFIFTLSDIVTVQRIARRYIGRKRADMKRMERDQQIENYLNLVEHVTEIQRFIRGYQARKQYERMENALVIQRVFRGYIVRYDVDLIKKYLESTRAQHHAAVAIQKTWRGYEQKQKYWYCLGCIIQIQCVARGAAGRAECADKFASIMLVQSLVRRRCAVRESKKMRDLNKVLAAGNKEMLEKDRAARTIQYGYKLIVEKKKCEPAAIKIQSFFRMVQAMILKEIKAEKKRRRIKKRKKKSTLTEIRDDKVLDDVLENVFVNGNEHFEMLQARTTPTKQKNSCSPVNNLNSWKKKLLPSALEEEDESTLMSEYERPAEIISLKKLNTHYDDSDAFSEVSGLTSASCFRSPRSRIKSMNQRAMEEDLELEEAYIDTNIQSAKEKRKTHRASPSKQRRIDYRNRS
eukprot:CAMPEP_0194258030 /NCGR_PEP_ID=MMETSP0158-20130606/40418_1 /TAXON_ID=33649 /ORGANISM="Thalassionema nitzschioides, Strain L26-B" /LENGTH=2814 /DNA_ID=CAMNT_0038997287 /DNA_START=32 /DNA_END=8472 /DNA_ORIENTATION=+